MPLIQLYRWTWPRARIKTVNGDMWADAWMDDEADRIDKNPDRTSEVRRRQDGKIAVFVNDITNQQHPKHSKRPK